MIRRLTHLLWRACCALLATATAPAAEIEGIIVSAIDGKPLKRAEVVLRPADPKGSAVGATTDEQGRFTFLDVPTGQYALQTSRAGFVPTMASYQNGARMVLPFAIASSKISGVVVRMQPAATIFGKVHHSDGEPAPGLLVQAYREIYERKRHRYEVAARTITDDRGNYRLFGLPAGRYYVAALFAPYDGRNDVRDQLVRDGYGQLVVPERTVTTFFPSAWKMTEATPVGAQVGESIGTTDIFLSRARTAVVKGRVLSGRSGLSAEGASLTLLREDASGTGFLPYPSAARMLQRGDFEIRGVVPGRYVLEARAAEQRSGLFARQALVVGNAAEVTANVLMLPEVEIGGLMFSASREEAMPAGVRVAAEPRSEGATRSAQPSARDGRFLLRLTAGETYDVILDNAPENTYVVSARLNDADVLTEGMRLESAGTVSLVVTVSTKGAVIQGGTEPGANVMLMPVGNSILARHSETTANEWGLFAFRAVAPGEYKVLAWFDDPPCNVWAPNAATECARFGATLHATESGRHTVSVKP